MSPHSPEDEVHVREHPLPGNSRLFTITLADGAEVTIVTDPTSPSRQLAITRPGADEPIAKLRMTGVESTTIAALLSGIRFVIERGDVAPVNAANLRTVVLPAGAYAVGLRLDELREPDPENARVIAVIRDDTSDLIEDDPERPCAPGDRLVLVGRPGSMSTLVDHLLG
ncbi:MAG TPA: TrkA C-terminal domain-containing protein [Ilumatobacter sp.]|nr:TrkA C-terminal domain-containing protein [Ilumatobacter sp.]